MTEAEVDAALASARFYLETTKNMPEISREPLATLVGAVKKLRAEREGTRRRLRDISALTNDLLLHEGALNAVDCGGDIEDVFGSSDRYDTAQDEYAIGKKLDAILKIEAPNIAARKKHEGPCWRQAQSDCGC